MVRGLEYYTGPVFEAELLLEPASRRGEPVRFGSIGGGGRYDDLVARFTGERTPATGFSFGVSRLARRLQAAGADERRAARARGGHRLRPERMADYFAIAAELRAAGVAAEVYLGASGMRPQMKYADRRLAPAAVIVGDDELAAGTVTVKDLDLGRALAAKVADNDAWRAERPGQATIPRAELVGFVRRIAGGADAAMRLEPRVAPPDRARRHPRAVPSAFGGAMDRPAGAAAPRACCWTCAGEAHARAAVHRAGRGAARRPACGPTSPSHRPRPHRLRARAEGATSTRARPSAAAPPAHGRPSEFLQIGLEVFGSRRPGGAGRRDRGAGLARGGRGRARGPRSCMGDVGLFAAFLTPSICPRALRRAACAYSPAPAALAPS